MVRFRISSYTGRLYHEISEGSKKFQMLGIGLIRSQLAVKLSNDITVNDNQLRYKDFDIKEIEEKFNNYNGLPPQTNE